MSEKRVFYPEIESLRGLAAFAVLLYHLIGVGPISEIHGGYLDHATPMQWLTFIASSVFNGTGAVMLFFVISGFVLGQGAPEALSGRYLASFTVRRLFRIMPAAWLSLGLATLCSPYYFGKPLDWSDWSGMLTLQDAAIKANGPLWSLQIEMLGSALYPFLFFASLRGGLIVQIGLLGLLFWLREHYGLPAQTMYLIGFQFGILVPQIVPALARMTPAGRALTIVISLLAVMLSTNFDRLGFINVREQVGIATFGSFFVVAATLVPGDTVLRRILLNPFARFLGRISYSLYLLNLLLILQIEMFVAIHFRDPMAGHLVVWLVGMPLSLAAGWLGYTCIEKPFHLLGRRLGRAIMAMPPVLQGGERDLPAMPEPARVAVVAEAAPKLARR